MVVKTETGGGAGGPVARRAAAAPARVFAVPGVGARRDVQDLRARQDVELVDAPRHADVLLLAGLLPPAWLKPAARVHDQMPRPRGVVCWGGPSPPRLFPTAVQVPRHEDPVNAIVDLHRDVVTGARASEPPVQPDHPPAPWRGVGPHSQGGEGMMGGRPYGRPMAMRAEARDGLQLDRVPVWVGPFFGPFPPGLTLRVGLQGDVVQEVAMDANPFLRTLVAPPPVPGPEPPTIAAIEGARAHHHLRWLADALRVAGLPALGLRVLRLAVDATPPDPGTVRRLGRFLERTRALCLVGRGVGPVIGEAALAFGGPVARAAGHERDARLGDPTYRDLGFAPAIRAEGDVRARWRVRIAETVASLELARRAPDRAVEGRVEPFAGGRIPGAITEVLTGLEWGDAVTTIVSLDLDLEADARARHGDAA